MDFIYGLAVFLVIFEGIIIQCEGMGASSSNQGQDISTNDIRGDQQIFPNELVELILSKSDFETIRKIIRSQKQRITDIIMSKILQDHIILIDRHEEFDVTDIREYHVQGDSFLRICNYTRLVQFFDRFGYKVKKIQISYSSSSSKVPHKQINQNIVKRWAKNLQELRFGIEGDWGFWEEISDGDNYSIFPEVKWFQNMGRSTQNKFELNLIFPKLESLKVYGPVADANCLANVKGLKELLLVSSSIEEHKLDDIFANNENLTKIYLSMLNRRETMGSIAKYLTKLETLGVEFPGRNFMLRANNNEVCKLPSVEHFEIKFIQMGEVFAIGNLSFVMPNLKKLTLNGHQTNGHLIDFINFFKKLEILELFVKEHITVGCIEELQHIKEITTTFYKNDFDSLKKMFERFDEKSKLQTLKFAYFRDSLYEFYEGEMEKINLQLKNSEKPTWTLSYEERFGTHRIDLIFRRKPCACKSGKK